MIDTKKCFKCEEIKHITSFYKHKQTKDGYLNKCVECSKKDVMRNYALKSKDSLWLEKERARGRDKYHRLEYKSKHSAAPKKKQEIMEKHKAKYPEKYAAKILSQRIPISIEGNHRHHWNYNLEFAKDIIELDVKTHNKIHRFLKYCKKTFMYKDLNGVLLDTKDKHLSYINKVIEL